MKNPKKIGNEYERKIIDMINKYLGSGYTKTKLSGGADHPGDMRDYWKTTPLAKYTIECKYHGSDKEFRKKIIENISQAIRQNPANRNWQLIIHLPNSQTELVIMDLQDYLVNDITSQMIVSQKDHRNIMNKIDNGFRLLKSGLEELKAKI